MGMDDGTSPPGSIACGCWGLNCSSRATSWLRHVLPAHVLVSHFAEDVHGIANETMAWKPPNVSGAAMSSAGYFRFKRSSIRNGGGRWPDGEGVLEAEVNLSMSMMQTGEQSVQRLMLQSRLGGGVD